VTAPRSRGQRIALRISLGALLITLVLLVYLLERWLVAPGQAMGVLAALPSTVLLALLAAGGAAETGLLLQARGIRVSKRYLALGGFLHVLAIVPWPGLEELDLSLLILVIWILVPALRGVLSDRGSRVVGEMSATALGLMYIPFLLGWLVRLRTIPDHSPPEALYAVLAVVLATKSSDVFAYLSGVVAGRHRAVPRISPGKTWEGYAGGLLGCVLVSIVLFRVIPAGEMLVPSWGGLAVLVLAMALLGPLGDLMESVLKRAAGVKDSGHLLPEFGGVLDVVDSLAVVAPAAYVVLVLCH
jgi:phosphatidate cytidylyltransferase